MSVFLRTAFNYDANVASFQSGLACKDPSLAQQHMRDETDINVLVARFSSGAAVLPPPPPPSEADFTGATDFMGAMNQIRRAQESFDALPARARAELNNSPALLLQRLQDPSWASTRGVELGLVNPPAPAASVPSVTEGTAQGSGGVAPGSSPTA